MSQSFHLAQALQAGQTCGRVSSLFSDKMCPVCHMPLGPQFPLPNVYSSISTGR